MDYPEKMATLGTQDTGRRQAQKLDYQRQVGQALM